MKKRVISLLLVIALALSVCVLSGCDKKDDLPVIGVLQLVEHVALDAARQGAVDALAEAGYVDGENCRIVVEYAAGEPTICDTIAKKFVADKVALIIAIATPAAQAAVANTKTIPIVFTAVTDPVSAQLVTSNDGGGENVAGVSDYAQIGPLMEEALSLVPTIKTIGALYNAGEVNSVSSVNELKAYCETKGITVIDGTVANTGEVQQVATSLASKVDAIYSPTDNAIATSITVAAQAAKSAKIPFIVGEAGMCDGGGLLTVGIDYYVVGTETGKIAAAILDGEKPGDIPTTFLTQLDLYLNKATADAIGLSIPKSVLDSAKTVYEK